MVDKFPKFAEDGVTSGETSIGCDVTASRLAAAVAVPGTRLQETELRDMLAGHGSACGDSVSICTRRPVHGSVNFNRFSSSTCFTTLLDFESLAQNIPKGPASVKFINIFIDSKNSPKSGNYKRT